MRVWLQKQKKKEDAKAAAQTATPPVETTSTAPEVQPAGDMAETPVESIEEASKAAGVAVEQEPDAVETGGDAVQREGSASAQPNQVGSDCSSSNLARRDSCDIQARQEHRGRCYASERMNKYVSMTMVCY